MQNKTNNYCTYCGKSVVTHAAFCVSCGMVPNKHKNYCQQCGVAVNEEQVGCVKCGTALNNVTWLGTTSKNFDKTGWLISFISMLNFAVFCLTFNSIGIIYRYQLLTNIYNDDFNFQQIQNRIKIVSIFLLCIFGIICFVTNLIVIHSDKNDFRKRGCNLNTWFWIGIFIPIVYLIARAIKSKKYYSNIIAFFVFIIIFVFGHKIL